MKKKSKVGLIIVLVLIIAIAVGVILVGMPILNELKEGYAQAVAYQEAGNYQKAYFAYANLGQYKDAQEQADQLDQLLKKNAAQAMAKAQPIADMGYYTLAGLYLTELLEDETQFYTEDFNAMADTVGAYYAAAEESYVAVMSVDEKMPMIVMQKLMDRLAALEESNDPAEALDILSGITSPPLAEQLLENCINRDTLADVTLAEIARVAPYWVPLVDQYFAAEEGLNITELVERQ